ncbi:HNH endonuclease [Rubinisphaera margarita]|uniref:HNH endonuclease n=1 Tax=Rubinisphaera margarita TaxID=2909586 RepID=UPI001EE9AC43|nr:HNH endonuclease [Rubinisphaera margarita]MCG6156691.1 HNH endonuclease [Rubinisphaera margarita]
MNDIDQASSEDPKLNRVALKERIIGLLRSSRDLSSLPNDHLLERLGKFEFSRADFDSAAQSVYRQIAFQYAKELDKPLADIPAVREASRLLLLEDDSIARLDYETGLSLYRRAFSDAIGVGEISSTEQEQLDNIVKYFGLRAHDVKSAVADQAIAYYTHHLVTAARDGEIDSEEISLLDRIAHQFGLGAAALKSVSVPNKREILVNALEAIKSQNEILDSDKEFIERLAGIVNAEELLPACLKDLELYQRVFRVRLGELPRLKVDSHVILERTEKLHYRVPVSFQFTAGGKIRKKPGELYVGSARLRFLARQKAHELRYKNILAVEFENGRSPKIRITVSSGTGGGSYVTTKGTDPGLLFEVSEAVSFLVRKAKGMAVSRVRDSRHIGDEIRSEVWFRDGGKCVLCGATEYLEFDHIIPHSKGGATSTQNLQILCRACNSKKSDSI